MHYFLDCVTSWSWWKNGDARTDLTTDGVNKDNKISDTVCIILGLLNHWDIIGMGFPNEVY